MLDTAIRTGFRVLLGTAGDLTRYRSKPLDQSNVPERGRLATRIPARAAVETKPATGSVGARRDASHADATAPETNQELQARHFEEFQRALETEW